MKSLTFKNKQYILFNSLNRNTIIRLPTILSAWDQQFILIDLSKNKMTGKRFFIKVGEKVFRSIFPLTRRSIEKRALLKKFHQRDSLLHAA